MEEKKKDNRVRNSQQEIEVKKLKEFELQKPSLKTKKKKRYK